METINIKDKKEEDRKFNGELIIRTDNNVPHGAGKTIRISEDVVSRYQEMYDEDENYFKVNNISYIIVMKVADYVARTWRGFEEKGKFDRTLPIDMIVQYEKDIQEMQDAVNSPDDLPRTPSGLILPK